MDQFGIENVCDEIMNGLSLTSLAKKVGVVPASLLSWIASDVERSARVRDCRAQMAKIWDEKALDEIKMAKDDFELRKAKEAAHHYRWRASAIGCDEYGDKVQLKHSGEMNLSQQSDEQLSKRLTQLLEKTRVAQP